MKNKTLANDYLVRSRSRLKAIESLYEDHNWADVVRESQEVVELTLKAALRHSNIDPPRTHDVSQVLRENESLLPPLVRQHLEEISKISKTLRKDRELSFYGSEDLTPSEFYEKADADQAKGWAAFVVGIVVKSVE
ncbi:MAG: HEPN domain-containing protein [Proteobacteria bacterium]|nr:HEPN domain-containing protein [Pseudomonadota bacterium]